MTPAVSRTRSGPLGHSAAFLSIQRPRTPLGFTASQSLRKPVAGLSQTNTVAVHAVWLKGITGTELRSSHGSMGVRLISKNYTGAYAPAKPVWMRDFTRRAKEILHR